jgi:hypothetical protein
MEKIKLFLVETLTNEKGKDILVVIILILVGLGSFELGRLSKTDTHQGIKVNYEKSIENQAENAISAIDKPYTNLSKVPFDINTSLNGKSFFASKRGKKYYTLGCSAGKTIKQENRIYFETSEQAEKAGYLLSSSCN